MNKEIEITKENYKEYIELYKILSDYSETNDKKIIFNNVLIPILVTVLLSIGIPELIPEIAEEEILLATTVIGSFGVGCGITMLVEKIDLKVKQQRYRKQNPNSEINIDVDEFSLYNILRKAGIISHEYREGIRIEKISTKKFEEKIKQEETIALENRIYEEMNQQNKYPFFIETGVSEQELLKIGNKIKQEMLEENKHNYSHLDFETEISNQELAKVKQKVKKMIR